MDLDAFQRAATATDRNLQDEALSDADPNDVVAPMLGLSAEAGSILNAYKRLIRNRITHQNFLDMLRLELGDLLWYTAAIANRFDLSLDEVAKANLQRTTDLYPAEDLDFELVDARDEPEHRFPRRMTFYFEDKQEGSIRRCQAYLVDADPNPLEAAGARRTQDGWYPIMDALDDNSWENDGYRFHDAVHLGFAAVLGWSPFLRKSLKMKRGIDKGVDRIEDGGRAWLTEEGMVAALWAMSKKRANYRHPRSLNEEALDLVQAMTQGLEVNAVTPWQWRQAISQGFQAAHDLQENGGGYLHLDLENHQLSFEPKTS